jgi:tetratricopeptide (TPR) repeat protein
MITSITRSFKPTRLNFIYVLLLILSSGCVVKDIGSTVEHTFKGDYYLQAEQYEQGEESFAQEVAENPNSPLANYYYGRFLLYNNDFKQALEHLQQARNLDPLNAEYHFWTGVAFGELNDINNEEASYKEALELDENHLQSLIYLGHIELEKKQYQKALDLYAQALDIWPDSPSALYNRALILHLLGRSPEERRGWLDYISRYPSGSMARQATDYLNLLGEFTFRNHRIGVRTVTIEKVWFEPFSPVLDASSHESLNVIGSIFEDLDKGTLQIVVYQKNNKDLARTKAQSIKRYLVDEFLEIQPEEIGVSWFSEPHKVSIKKKNLTIDESVSFFVTTK